MRIGKHVEATALGALHVAVLAALGIDDECRAEVLVAAAEGAAPGHGATDRVVSRLPNTLTTYGAIGYTVCVRRYQIRRTR